MESGAVALRTMGTTIRPVALAGEQALPIDEALTGLFPDGLRRGEVIGVVGPAAVSCALALAAGPSAAGSWTLVAGSAGERSGAGWRLGVGAAVALGVVPERLVVLRPGRLDGAAWMAALTAAVDGFEVVVVRPPAVVTPGLWRRLGPRVRDRGGVLVGVELPRGWERASTVTTSEVVWEGIGAGHGHVRSRSVLVERVGRGAASRPRRIVAQLPGPDGRAVTTERSDLVELGARRVS